MLIFPAWFDSLTVVKRKLILLLRTRCMEFTDRVRNVIDVAVNSLFQGGLKRDGIYIVLTYKTDAYLIYGVSSLESWRILT